MDIIEKLFKNEPITKKTIERQFIEAETFEEKQLILLLEIRNGLNSVRNMITFFTILTVINLLLVLFF